MECSKHGHLSLHPKKHICHHNVYQHVKSLPWSLNTKTQLLQCGRCQRSDTISATRIDNRVAYIPIFKRWVGCCSICHQAYYLKTTSRFYNICPPCYPRKTIGTQCIYHSMLQLVVSQQKNVVSRRYKNGVDICMCAVHNACHRNDTKDMDFSPNNNGMNRTCFHKSSKVTYLNRDV